MTSTISAGTLTVTVSESISLNGSTMDATNSLTIGSINEISQRIVTVDVGALRTLFEFGTVIAPGKFIVANVKYIRITNKDDNAVAGINLASAASNCWVAINPMQTLMMSAQSGLEGVASAVVGSPALADLTKITGFNQLLPFDLDCYIALT
jgi:hypothetical protein